MAQADPAAPASARPRVTRPPLLLALGFAVFVGALAAVVGASFARHRVATFAPTAPFQSRSSASAITDTVTVDARDPVTWRFFSFTRGVLAASDTAAWDLAFRRFHVIASGAVAGSRTAFEELREAPATGYAATVFIPDTVNPTVARWYRYSYVTHLLTPDKRSYVVRTSSGGYAKLEFLSYYCPGPTPGCVTFRYASLNVERRNRN